MPFSTEFLTVPHCCELAVHQSDSESDGTLTGQKLRKRSNSFPFVRSWMASQPILFEQWEAATCYSRGKANMYYLVSILATTRKKWREYFENNCVTEFEWRLARQLDVVSNIFATYTLCLVHCLYKRINRCKLLSPEWWAQIATMPISRGSESSLTIL